MLNDEVGAPFVVDCASEARFNLLGDVEVVEDGYVGSVFLDNVGLFWRNELDVVVNLAENLMIVYVNTVVGRIKEITYQRNTTALFFKGQFWRFGTSL